MPGPPRAGGPSWGSSGSVRQRMRPLLVGGAGPAVGRVGPSLRDRSPETGHFLDSRRPVLWLKGGTGPAVGPVPAAERPPPGPGDVAPATGNVAGGGSRALRIPCGGRWPAGRSVPDGEAFLRSGKGRSKAPDRKIARRRWATGGRDQWKAPIRVTSTMMAMRPHTTGPPSVPRPAAASRRSSAASMAASASCTTSFSAAASL